MNEDEDSRVMNTIQYYWELALASNRISPQLSKSMIFEMLESIKASDKPIPDYFKKLFCFKCFAIFKFGENVKITISATKKHPNMKIIEYRFLGCQNIQRINAQRLKNNEEKQDSIKEEENIPISDKKVQQKRKLFTNFFS